MLHKTRLKQLLYGYELRSAAIIANGLVHHTPKKIILDTMRKDLVRVKELTHLDNADFTFMWVKTVDRYNKISRKTFSTLRKAEFEDKKHEKKSKDYAEKLKLRQDIVYSELRDTVLNQLEREKNDVANHVEDKTKRDSLRELLKEGVFFLCSSHEKPAKDHVGWEGKIYVTEDWEDRIDDPSTVKKIRAYIRNHDIRTVQWVTGAPVYLLFRPNCKHYFIRVQTEEVLGSSVKSLLKRHKLYMQEELPMSYEKTQYKAYYERLKALVYLNKMAPSEQLQKDIKATRKLVMRWAYRAREAG